MSSRSVRCGSRTTYPAPPLGSTKTLAATERCSSTASARSITTCPPNTGPGSRSARRSASATHKPWGLLLDPGLVDEEHARVVGRDAVHLRVPDDPRLDLRPRIHRHVLVDV